MTIPLQAYSLNREAPYPKAIAGSLLARTDFATLLGMFSREQQGAIANNVDTWVTLLLQIINASLDGFKVLEDSRIFPRKAFSLTTVPDYEDGGLTLGEWFRALAQAPGQQRDLLTTRNYASIISSAPAGRQKSVLDKQAEALESLGGFGAKMDPALITGQPQRPIFEFRTLATVYTDYLDLAGKAFWDYIAYAHTL